MEKNQFINKNIHLPIKEFLMKMYPLAPTQRGINFQKYLIKNSNLYLTNSQIGQGDCYITKEKTAEIKISYLNDNGKFNIRNLTIGSKYEWFILCFVYPNKNFKSLFYCVKKNVIMENPIIKLTNMHKNTPTLLGTTIKEQELKWLLDRHNLLEGNNYSDLIKFINENDNNKTHTPIKHNIRNKKTKVSFLIDGKIINGQNNCITVTNMVKHIGPKKLNNVIWKSQLNTVKTDKNYVNVGDGYYLNPKFSIRDIHNIVKQINKKLNKNVTILS